MKIASLDVTPELLVEFCKAIKIGTPRRFIVRENPLPDDTELQYVGYADDRSETVRLYLTSETFAEVAGGEKPPQLPLPVLETVFEDSV